MAAITVKNIPAGLYEKLKVNARRNHRSINSEIIVCLEKVLESQASDPQEWLTRIRQVRQSIQAPPLTDEFLEKARAKGRK